MKECIFITGASSGIGRALTVLFANSGHIVIGVGKNDIELQRTKSMCKDGKVIMYTADLSLQSEIDRLAHLSEFESGFKIKYLIHAAASGLPHVPLTQVTRTDFDLAIGINCAAPIFLTQRLIPFYAKDARVLIFGSDYVGINRIRPFITALYAASKSALRPCIEHMRIEYQPTLLVGHLNPGATQTRLFDEVKTSVLNSHGIFNVAPASPINVAEFTKATLENTSPEDFTQINFDFRDAEHHRKVSGIGNFKLIAKL